MFGITRAPELDRPGLQWLNVDRPLSLQDLQGRLVILDFWTSCSVNSLHVLPTLNKIMEAYGEDVVVIGVHSPKFDAERNPVNVLRAIERYGIRHPIVHDPQMILWDDYGIRAWPTLVIIDAKGRVIGDMPGEPNPDLLVTGIGKMIQDIKESGQLAPAPPPAVRVAPDNGDRTLKFPGKIKPLRGAGGEKSWAVADSGHHQIVILGDDGRERRRIGSGNPGFFDGDLQGCSFNSPQGLISADGILYVADSGNHAIRRIDLDSGDVSTLAGTGYRGKDLQGQKAGHEVSLASVWDLEVNGSQLYFANAGTHQIGIYDLTDHIVRPLAGNSGGDIVDGAAPEAELAQPNGLALDDSGSTLYFADSESSAIRSLSLDNDPQVTTLSGQDLFEFGHTNGAFSEALFQHPMGLAVRNGGLVVADSFNGCLRQMDFHSGRVSDLGEIGFDHIDCDYRMDGEPAGVIADGDDRLLVSDTNNHRIVEIDLKARTLRTWA
ncbi:MAG: redoxin domain-containing protein [Rhodospirillales bacterium]|nr:redoxin domain-containing protein [Rhodospirillales bacterium]